MSRVMVAPLQSPGIVMLIGGGGEPRSLPTYIVTCLPAWHTYAYICIHMHTDIRACIDHDTSMMYSVSFWMLLGGVINPSSCPASYSMDSSFISRLYSDFWCTKHFMREVLYRADYTRAFTVSSFHVWFWLHAGIYGPLCFADSTYLKSVCIRLDLRAVKRGLVLYYCY